MIYDTDAVKLNAVEDQRTPREAGDQKVIFWPLETLSEPSWIQERREEILIYVAGVVTYNIMR